MVLGSEPEGGLGTPQNPHTKGALRFVHPRCSVLQQKSSLKSYFNILIFQETLPPFHRADN